MPTLLTPLPLWAATFVLLAVGLSTLIYGLRGLPRGRPVRLVVGALLGVALLATAALGAALSLALHGWTRLGDEQTAALLTVNPAGKQRFDVTLRRPEGADSVHRLQGDELVVDAQIVRWAPGADRLGLHTAYRLVRIGAKYHGVMQDLTAPSSGDTLAKPTPVDLGGLLRRVGLLSHWISLQPASATIATVGRAATWELRASPDTGAVALVALPR